MFGSYDPVALQQSLQIMGQGMGGIFAIMLLITAIVALFTKLTK